MKFIKITALLALLTFSSAAEAASRFWVGGTGTWDAVTTTHWSTTTGGAGGASVPSSIDQSIFDANSGGGTVTVATNFNVSGIAWSNYTGIWDNSVNNNTPTIGSFSFSISQASGGATINCGTGTWTMAAANLLLQVSNVTSVTLNCSSTPFSFTSTQSGARAIQLVSGASLGPISIAAATSGGTGTLIQGNGGTIASLSVAGPNRLLFRQGQTLNITGAMNLNSSGGASALVLIESEQGTGTPGTISTASGSSVINWAAISNMTFSGGATFTAVNSFDIKSNTGITITPPSLGGGVCIIGGNG